MIPSGKPINNGAGLGYGINCGEVIPRYQRSLPQHNSKRIPMTRPVLLGDRMRNLLGDERELDAWYTG